MGFGDYPIGLGIDNTFNLQPGIPAPHADLQAAWTKEVFETTHALSRGRKVPPNCPKHIKDCPTMAGVHTFSNHFLAASSRKKTGGELSLVPHPAFPSRHFLLLRFFRMVRLVRLLRYMPEVIILVKGLGVASRS